MAETARAIESELQEDAHALHAKAQRDKTSVAEFEGAAGLYDCYLSRLGGEPRAYAVHFDLAEIDFFRLGRNLDAAAHYMAAARGIPENERSGPLATMRHAAIYNALVSLAREMDKTPGETTGASGAAPAAAKVSVDPRARAADDYAEALELYAHYYPGDPELAAMFYRQGQHDFDNGHYDAAVKIWGLLIEKFPDGEPARDAGESILESFNRAKNYENIETWARRLKSLPSFRTSKQQERLDALIARSAPRVTATGRASGCARSPR